MEEINEINIENSNKEEKAEIQKIRHLCCYLILNIYISELYVLFILHAFLNNR